MAKRSPASSPSRPRVLVLELWGLGDLALAMPFLRSATLHANVTLVAKPQAAPLLARFAPEVDLIPLHAPWTAFTGKYRLHRWPWHELIGVLREVRRRAFDFAVSARRDPRDHLMLALTGARRRLGFPRRGSQFFLTNALANPPQPHRSQYWDALTRELGWPRRPVLPSPRAGRHVVIHTGAGHPVRVWPEARFAELAARLREREWQVTFLDSAHAKLEVTIEQLAIADRFIGNDSGPGHLAALLGVPTFTIFGPQLPELFAPQHPQAAWIPGAPCRYKPCFDACRFPEPFCIRDRSVDDVWTAVQAWLAS